jgi:hypothetical protein
MLVISLVNQISLPVDETEHWKTVSPNGVKPKSCGRIVDFGRDFLLSVT